MAMDNRSAAAFAALLALSGCSTLAPLAPLAPGGRLETAAENGKPAKVQDPSTKPFNFTTSSGDKTPGGEGAGYALSEDEQAMDCKKLTGRMQIRIMDVRGYDTRERTTMAARGLHTAGKMVFGGTNAGLNTDTHFAKDKAMLDAYNARLVAKDCRSFDIPEALQGSGPPSPTIEAPSKAKAKADAPQKP
jgi:hypothetical protein